MERIKITNKKNNPKTFFAANGIEITLEEGDNFISEEDLQYLQKHSDGFKHFVAKRILVVRDEKREETEDEKAERKNLMQKAAAMFKNSMPGKANKAGVLEQSPMLDLSASTEEFDKTIADSATKKLEEFNTKAQELGNQVSESIKGQVQADTEKELLPTLKKSFNDSLQELRKQQLDAFKAELMEIVEEELTAFQQQCAEIAKDALPSDEAEIDSKSITKNAKRSGKNK